MSSPESDFETLVGQVLDCLGLAHMEMVQGAPEKAMDHLASAAILRRKIDRLALDVSEDEYVAAGKLRQTCADLIQAVHRFARERLDRDLPVRRAFG